MINHSKAIECMDNSTMPTIEELNLLVSKYAPILYFDAEDKNKIISIIDYLENALLVNDTEKTKMDANLNNLPVGFKNKGSYHLELKDQTNKLNKNTLNSAKTYVNVKRHSDKYTDLQFWFFFAQNQAATASIKWYIDTITGHSAESFLEPLGQQEACWRRIAIRIDNENKEITEVFLQQPKKGVWIPIENIEKSGSQPILYVSNKTHFFYHKQGVHFSEALRLNVYSSALEFSFKNTTAKDVLLDCSECYELVAVDYLKPVEFYEPSWLNFTYRWGKEDASYLTQKNLKEIITRAFGTKLEFLLSNSISTELMAYLQTYFTLEIQNASHGPKNHECWLGDETD